MVRLHNKTDITTLLVSKKVIMDDKKNWDQKKYIRTSFNHL